MADVTEMHIELLILISAPHACAILCDVWPGLHMTRSEGA